MKRKEPPHAIAPKCVVRHRIHIYPTVNRPYANFVYGIRQNWLRLTK
jgi:hypothetical protein